MPLMKGWCYVGKLADVLKQERKEILRMLRIVVAVQTFGVMEIALTLRTHM